MQWTTEQDNELMAEYAGYKQATVRMGSKYGVSRTTILNRLRYLGVTIHPPTRAAIGVDSPRWKGGRNQAGFGYIGVRERLPHPRSHKGYVLEHVKVAEKALGHQLPKKHPVHHIDENRANNANINLVICESHRYHLLLHTRMRVLKAGGDPHFDKLCGLCGMAQPRSAFRLNATNPDGFDYIDRKCRKSLERNTPRRRRRNGGWGKRGFGDA